MKYKFSFLLLFLSGIFFFSSCKKYGFEPGSGHGKGLGGIPTLTDLKIAAANLTRLSHWITGLYPLGIEYEAVVFALLNSTKQDNPNWSNFIGNLFIDISVGITGAVANANVGSPSLPAFACLSAFLKDWNLGKGTPPDLAVTFEEFIVGHGKMQIKIEEKLHSLADPANNYSNLLNQWKDAIEFNGKSYTLSDLANSTFPAPGEEYDKLQADAYTYYKKSLWNLVIMTCCSYFENYHQYPVATTREYNDPHPYFYKYNQKTFYPEHKGVYVRGDVYDTNAAGRSITYELIYYNLGIGGYAIPDAAAAELFIDDTPEHIINPRGLWNRSYVFKQFSLTKYEFKGFELASYPNNPNNGPDFNTKDTYDFTGGLFPRLIQ